MIKNDNDNNGNNNNNDSSNGLCKMEDTYIRVTSGVP